jgi:hypothetical protein
MVPLPGAFGSSMGAQGRPVEDRTVNSHFLMCKFEGAMQSFVVTKKLICCYSRRQQ